VVTERRAPAARAPREEGKEAEVVPPQPGTVYDVFSEVFPHVPFVATQGLADVIITVPREAIHNVLRGAREEDKLKFDYLRDLCGVDEVERSGAIDIVYHLYSFTHKHTVTLKCPVPVDDPVIPSAIDIWVGADWHERETAEMFGVTFDGHPHLVPLLLEEGLNIHPLRKDHPLAEVEIKQGLDVIAFKERFNWGGSGIGEEVVSEEGGTVSTEAAAAAAAAAPSAPAAPRKKLTPEELEAAKQRAAAMRAEHEAKKASGEFQPAERKKRYTPEEIAAIKERAGVTSAAAAPTTTPASEQAGPPAPEPAEAEAAAAPAEPEAPAETPAAAAPAPARKLTPEEIEEVKKRAAAMRAEHAEKKARGEVSTERKKRYTPEEIEEIKRRAQEQKG
jgi:NADH:ubiquinone oxidoreductase subunit C